MWGDMSLWNVQGPLLHSWDHIVQRILTVDYTFKPRSDHVSVPPTTSRPVDDLILGL